MAVKEKIIDILQKNKGEYVSGEQLAETLGVSRTAVWKAIKKLQEEHYNIEAITNKGYKFSIDNDLLTESGISSYLDGFFSVKLEVVEKSVSTNIEIKDKLFEDEGFVLVAKEQTDGMGRLGRKFYSPSNTGVYFSVLLKPDIANDELSMLTSIAALSVCEAIEKLSDKKPSIKWVNDVFVNDKKVSGTLTQASFSMEDFKPEYIIVGIGANLYAPENGFAEEIKGIAGYIFDEKIGDLKNRFVAYVLNSFFKYYKSFENKKFVLEYRKRNFVIGRKVNILSAKKSKEVFVLDIDDRCRLLVEHEDGTKETLSSGEISITI